MAKKLHMTTADYLVIAVSPALIMAMVGSLVYFLIEVFYEGDYAARLDYAFGLFVFAAVLVARISIEEGREYAALFALPLGGAMYLVLLKFAEHPSPFSWLINLALMCLVWWCADRLTWDSTVIDDDEDASGEGLMQRIGVDGPAKEGPQKKQAAAVAPTDTKENELFETQAAASGLWQRLKRLVMGKRGPHTPGIWVFYFSLGALPLFGLGQYWIPSADTGRRRYAFSLLLVYVASALALLVTTSFLNLRRYLRQRRLEMPLSIAGTWVGVGAVLIVIVMMVAMMIPRPAAEVAISQVPWHVGSPGGVLASRAAANRDGGEKQDDEQQSSTAGEKASQDGQASQPPNGEPSGSKAPGKDGKESTDNGQGKGAKESKSGEAQDGKQSSEGKAGQSSNGVQRKDKKAAEKEKEEDSRPAGKQSSATKKSEEKKSESNGRSSPTASALKKPLETVQNVVNTFRGWGLLKWLFYIVAGAFLIIATWKHRDQITQAVSDILRMLRELFSGRRTADVAAEDEKTAAKPRARSFAEFRDPFASGQHGQIPPEELVRYTFAAFEAWANDRGRPRAPDCTPMELVGIAVEPKTPLAAEARKLVRLYGEVAYASWRVPRGAAEELRGIWQLMRSTQVREVSDVGR
jgi:hypothetical protein